MKRRRVRKTVVAELWTLHKICLPRSYLVNIHHHHLTIMMIIMMIIMIVIMIVIIMGTLTAWGWSRCQQLRFHSRAQHACPKNPRSVIINIVLMMINDWWYIYVYIYICEYDTYRRDHVSRRFFWCCCWWFTIMILNIGLEFVRLEGHMVGRLEIVPPSWAPQAWSEASEVYPWEVSASRQST